MTEVGLHIGGLRLEGFDRSFADRAGEVFQAALQEQFEAPGVAEHLLARQGRTLGALVLDGIDTTTPEALGRGLARALMREVLR